VYCHSIAPSIDGVCRRFTNILHELVQEGHSVLLYTLEEDPQDIPSSIETIWLDFLLMPAYPNKRVAKPELLTLYRLWSSLSSYRPDYIHVTGDGISQLFAMVGLLLGIPVVGSFHTDILDLLSSHNANFFQKWCIQFKEGVDSFILDSCATTSVSFAVSTKIHPLALFSASLPLCVSLSLSVSLCLSPSLSLPLSLCLSLSLSLSLCHSLCLSLPLPLSLSLSPSATLSLSPRPIADSPSSSSEKAQEPRAEHGACHHHRSRYKNLQPKQEKFVSPLTFLLSPLTSPSLALAPPGLCVMS
jgi:hypothetical protein